jgi:hypothetical protein
LLDAHQHDSASVLCYCLGPNRLHPKKVRRRHEQIPPPSPNQASQPSECYREVVSAVGFQLRPELLSLDRLLNQRPRRSGFTTGKNSTQVERQLIETIATEAAPKSARKLLKHMRQNSAQRRGPRHSEQAPRRDSAAHRVSGTDDAGRFPRPFHFRPAGLGQSPRISWRCVLFCTVNIPCGNSC